MMLPLTISESFQNIRLDNKMGFIPYIVAGDPDLETTKQILYAFDRLGVTCIELGLPHTDQLADGPVIQNAALRSIQRGTTFERVLSCLESVKLQTPIVLFSSYNLVLAQGDSFMERIASAGVKGLLIPDLPPEDAGKIQHKARSLGIDMIYLIAPTTKPERIQYIISQSHGFIYLMSSVGTTGAKDHMPSDLQKRIQKIKLLTGLPVVVGFGISQYNHVQAIQSMGADGVIVGARLVETIAITPKEEVIDKVSDLVLQLTRQGVE